MNRFSKMAVAGALASTACVGMVAPAEARVGTSVAIGAGLLGLGIGAAIASDHPHYYDDGYYAPTYYSGGYYGCCYAPPVTVGISGVWYGGGSRWHDRGGRYYRGGGNWRGGNWSGHRGNWSGGRGGHWNGHGR